jgi:hypothetical protein
VSVFTALVNRDHLTNSEIAKYLRESQCGFEAGSHKVCCNIESIDFGLNKTSTYNENITDETFQKFDKTYVAQKNISNYDKCGLLNEIESPSKWLAEIWFINKHYPQNDQQLRCSGVLITKKHVIVPASCVVSVPENISL